MKSHYSSIETTLKPKSYGKRDQRMSNSLKTRVTITLFKAQKPVFKIMPYISANGKMTPVRLTLAYLADSTTTNTNLASRPIFVSSSLDPHPYETSDNRIVFSDSNEEMLQQIKHDSSPWNAMTVTGNFGSANIPFDTKTWDNNEHNKHAIEFISKATAVANAKNLTDVVRQTTFDKLYAEYQAKEQELLDSGIIVPNSIIVAKDSGIQPTIALNQTVQSRNQFFNADKVLGHENSLATYAPITNVVYGAMRITDSTSAGNWNYGMIENNGLQSFSTSVNLFDFRNKIDTHEARIVMRDRFRAQEGQRTRSQALQEFIESNSTISVMDAELRLGLTELGGLTSIFSIEGDDITYTKAMAGAESPVDNDVDFDMDQEVEISTLEEFAIKDESDFLATLGSF